MKKSAGILAYRLINELEVFLVHPGGPFFRNKDAGVWSIPKGEYTEDEDGLAAAQREFLEETGQRLNGTFMQLEPVKQKGGKVVIAWAIKFDVDETKIISNSFSLEWPPRSGNYINFPEVDKAGWFTVEVAKEKIISAQTSFVEQLIAIINSEASL